MKNKDIFIGILVGLLLTITGTFLCMLYIMMTENASFELVLNRGIASGEISSLIVFGAALNFLGFFGFLRINKEQRAKGVLIITIAIAVAIMIYKLLS